jgi:creatinine amidohydrolase
MLTSGYWQNLTTRDFAGVDAERTIAVLPVAAIEQHGPHLPLETDALINDGIVRATLERLPRSPTVLVLPAQNVGTSPEHADFPGTLSIDAETLLRVWLDIGASVARAGVRKLVIFNTHGGQRALVDLAALRLRVAHDIFVVRANYFSFGAPDGLFSADEWIHGIHGGEVETSLMLHLAPDRVHRDALENFAGLSAELARENELLGAEKPIGFGWKAQDLNPAGVCGNAAAADAKRGALHLEHLATRFTALLAEVGEIPLGVISNARD